MADETLPPTEATEPTTEAAGATVEPTTEPTEAAPEAPTTEPTEPAPTAAPVTAPAVKLGDIVHVTLDRGPHTGDCRPAIVVRVWNATTLNVQMFTDGVNDHQDYASGLVWLTSVPYAQPVAGQPTPQRTWHAADEDA